MSTHSIHLQRSVCLIWLLLAAATTSRGQTFTTVANFGGADGAGPYSMQLVQGTDGNLYGTTTTGGANGYGTIFRATPAGEITTLYNFCSQKDCADGSSPYEGLVLATDGNFYGATTWGGTSGWGTVFKISPEGALVTLHSFEGTEGFYPRAPLIQASDRNFYGTISTGESSGAGGVFKVTPDGTVTVLHTFSGVDGSDPMAGLVQGTDGNLYGTTFAGGTGGACLQACGTIFKISLAGKLTTLHSFDLADGAYPDANLVQAIDGNFYGTTNGGGTSGWGTVFKITPTGALTTLHSFDLTDGGEPYAGLSRAATGDFYGSTRYGGEADEGTLFEITPAGVLTTLHSFDGGDGTDPSGGLFQATNGIFYGAAWGGGNLGDGTIFSESVGLRAFVAAVPGSGKTGTLVTILGNNLAGATSVTFKGIAASFKVESATAIKTTVPTGASTGPVQVVTPTGTLTSNVNFQVEP